MRHFLLTCLFLAAACANIKTDADEVGELPNIDGASVEFDPAAAIIPFPNDLVTQFIADPTGPRIVTLPPQCAESATAQALREGVLNALDGFGTFKTVLRVTVSAELPEGDLSEFVRLYKYDRSGLLGLDPTTAEPVPVAAFRGDTTRFSADCGTATQVHAMNIVPTVPLEEDTEYFAVVLSGLASDAGETLLPSQTWSLVRQAENPVTVEDGKVVAERTPFEMGSDDETLLGLNGLWATHAQGLAFAEAAMGDVSRRDMLVGFSFKTQTVTQPLDASVANSPASAIQAAPLAGLASITGPASAEDFLIGVLGAPTCAAIGCAAVGGLQAGAAIGPDFRTLSPGPLGDDVAGPWSHPLQPALITENAAVPVILSIPASPMPKGGYPVVVFGHGITRSKSDALGIVSQFAARGIAVVAMDFPNHGDRADQVSNDVTRGCGGDPDPTAAPQCFAPFFSGNLAATRDNFRQAALDVQSVVSALETCTIETCGGLEFANVGYLGASLGAIIGTTAVAMEPGISASVLNAGGTGFVDLIENTDSLGLRCALVDGLIAAGIVQGTPSNLLVEPATGTCTTDAWKTQPAYQAFAVVARWVLDPGDGANYATRLALSGRPTLIQEIAGDGVVPNVVTRTQGALMGLGTVGAAVAASPTPDPTAAMFSDPVTPIPSHVVYGGPGVVANTYSHSSLLLPVDDGGAGQLGTAQLQTDAIAYLSLALNPPPQPPAN